MGSFIKQIGLVIVTSLIFISCGSNSSNDEGTNGEDIGNIFASSNTTSIVSVFNFSDLENITSVQFGTASNDADGIYYNSTTDRLYLVSRSNNRLEIYDGLTTSLNGTNLNLLASSAADFTNGRKLAVSGNTVLVAQDAAATNDQQNRFYAYDVTGGTIRLITTYDPQINLWDMQFHGEKLYAIIDNSDSLAVFNNILANQGGAVNADQKVQIEGILRTHALYYDEVEDIMFMTDIGEASSDSDGGIHIIQDFSTKLSAAGDRGTISLSDQIVISGSNTELGNPVGVSYDRSSELIYVAERAVEGGKLVVFRMPTASGNENPLHTEKNSGTSAIYIGD
ncbi:hypothetical protein [Balneola vulgaris]|uniref:hypothetical protein n=1 Tax=Balneola vulgaris TaxID=287535 RepID=UPI00035CCFA3|nr:hypothetical protein [Balneola vulgaris]